MKLKDKVCIVTGGSGGIGMAVADKFLSEGAKVILTSIDLPSAKVAEDELKKKHPNSIVKGIAPTPLWNFERVQKEFDEIVKEFGAIDVLVNNAGMSDETPFSQYTEDIYDRLFNLNIKAIFACTRAVIPYMEKQEKGAIVNVSSVVTVCGQPIGVAYPSSKSAVNGFTLSLARELAGKGIRVNAVAPGITKTTMLKDVPSARLERVAQAIPLKRIGEPTDAANAITFLASDDASYVTGTVLSVDGLARF